MEQTEKVYWLVGSEENNPYQVTTWYRCPGIENFVEKVNQKNKIVGVIFSDNNLGFVLQEL